MLLYNLKIAFRNATRNLGYTIINFMGISVGLAVCLLMGLYIRNETSYDKYHEKKDRIYRIVSKTNNGNYEGIAKIAGPFGPAALQSIPEIEDYSRFLDCGELLVSNNEKKFYESAGFYADSSVFNIFSWKLLRGDQKTVLSKPQSIVVSRTFANKYFGDNNAVGQSLMVDNTIPFTVTGVFEEIPGNSHFDFDFLLSMSSYTDESITNWVRSQFYTYILVKPGASIEGMIPKLDRLLASHVDSALAASSTPFLQSLTSIHLHSSLFREIEPNSDISYVYISGTLALFIILIASLNFINLSTARAIRRSKEVGIRKTNGASRSSLVIQYMCEAMIICFASMLVAIGLAYLALPSLNTLLEKKLYFSWFTDEWLFIGLPVLVIIVGFLSGFYPAIVLSSFKPVSMFGKWSLPSSRFSLRKVLVVSQFVISIIMIIGALVSGAQLKYVQNKNLGFNKNQVINIPFHDGETARHSDAIKDRLLKIPGVEQVSASGNRPGGSDYGIPARIIGLPDDRQIEMRCLVVDEDFLNTYEIPVAEGRGFSHDFPSDTAAYMINEEAARQLGLSDPIGKMMEMPALKRGAGPIVGVVKDFHFHSLHDKIGPLYFIFDKQWFGQLSVRINTKLTDVTLAQLKKEWTGIEPTYPFTYTFFDEEFSEMYNAENRSSTMIRVFASLAIFIACLGLFGLTTYVISRRIKEVGVRKILGASVVNVTFLLSKDFLKLVMIAAFIAFPAGWWLMNRWLEDFAYRVNIGWQVFVIAGLAALGIALLTVSFQAIRAALANPVKSLRTE
jgi:putative ABC transport system permease protein